MTGNTISNNNYGLGIDSSSGGTYTGNTIMNNSSYGLYYTGSVVIDATYNYWGDASGPLDNSDDRATGGWYNPAGLGDRVSDKVNYYPWTIDVTDTDNDGLHDDGDNSGIAGDNPCTGGILTNCDDNCWLTPNTDQTDSDNDLIGDACDNCRLVKNPDQRDSNSYQDDNSSLPGIQHYGDMCDPDFDNSGFVNIIDFNEWRKWAGKTIPPAPAYIDLDGNGTVWIQDFNIWRKYYGKAPGPGAGD
ncbi:MAG: hypothetical protein HY808_09400 [Nitrospirae bacterium]|nr:hypothetical protein [Nitrospirota bacterium]